MQSFPANASQRDGRASYQHATADRDRLLADAASALARRNLPPEAPAAALPHDWRTSDNSGADGHPARDDDSNCHKHVFPGHDTA